MDWLRQLPIGQSVGDTGGWLPRLDPRLKLAWTVAFLMTPILAGSLWRLGLVALLLLITAAGGLPWRLWRRSVPLLLALALLVGLLSALLPASTAPPISPPRPPAELGPAEATAPSAGNRGLAWELVRWGPVTLGPLPLGPLVVTRRSAELGISGATLLFTLVHSANLLLLTTAPEALVWALAWWIRPLALVGVPVERLGFLLLLSLRFLPLVQEELQNLLRALATRAVHLRALGWKGGLGLALAVGERLLANVLLRSEQGAEALLARGGRWLPPDRLHEPPARFSVASGLATLALLLLLALRWRYGGAL
ncbi:MAG: CbiQ family ECF transporter T component [Cyanobacteriota bacterium]|nr:CbiQ family ECF transporter T component [Cyanobacteriota bacterium]